ncbi:hypothetical protein HY045_03820 [Candidatus Woesebacteria bacterium]|nr:hypothetical protein [Candidatus Woesebacteria bacterium]
MCGEQSQNSELSFEEQKARCPIHKWANIDLFLARAQVPERLWEPFHKLVIARGMYPGVYETAQDMRKFSKYAMRLMKVYNVSSTDAGALSMVFGDLVNQWIESGIKNN